MLANFCRNPTRAEAKNNFVPLDIITPPCCCALLIVINTGYFPQGQLCD
jgi:hypothetical protein